MDLSSEMRKVDNFHEITFFLFSVSITEQESVVILDWLIDVLKSHSWLLQVYNQIGIIHRSLLLFLWIAFILFR
jgi:hypothetical protein